MSLNKKKSYRYVLLISLSKESTSGKLGCLLLTWANSLVHGLRKLYPKFRTSRFRPRITFTVFLVIFGMNQTHGGLGQVVQPECTVSSIGHAERLKFQTGIFVARKAPENFCGLFSPIQKKYTPYNSLIIMYFFNLFKLFYFQ